MNHEDPTFVQDEDTIEANDKQIFIERGVIKALMRLQAPMMYVNTTLPSVPEAHPPLPPPLPEAELLMKLPSKMPELMQKKNLIASWFNTSKLKMDLIYSATTHGLSHQAFYRNCGGRKNLLIIIKSKVYN